MPLFLPSFWGLRTGAVLVAILFAVCHNAFPTASTQAGCPNIVGDIIVNQYQLYPENLDFDSSRCLIFFGSLFDASVVVYNPYNKTTVDVLSFDNVTHNPDYHIGGVTVNPVTSKLSIVVDVGAAFNTFGTDISGTNWFMTYDYDRKMILTKINLTQTTLGEYGGPQDVEHDRHGNAYIVFTFPSAILKVENATTVTEWFQPNTSNHFRQGFGGLATVGDVLLSNDNSNGNIVRFDMRDERGTPVEVPLTPNYTLGASDAIYFPPKYKGSVLLVAESSTGITVLQSNDTLWRNARYLGMVPNTGPSDSLVTAPVQIGNSVYMNLEFFSDAPVTAWKAGNRTMFPLLDITQQVDKLVTAGHS